MKQKILRNKLREFTVSLLALLAVVLAAALPAVTHAADYPKSTITLVVPGGPGTSLDITARMLADEITRLSNAPVVVLNRPGAGSQVGAEYVARSEPDGYTWLIAPFNVLSVNPHVMDNVKDPFQDSSFLTTIFEAPYFMIAHPALPANNVQELVKLAKAQPGVLNYGSGGPGSANQIAGELFKRAADVDITEIPYTSAALVQPDLIAGRVQLFFTALGPVLNRPGYPRHPFAS